MNMKEKYEWFMEKLREEGYEYAGGIFHQDCDTYKYAGDVEALKGSIVNVCKIRRGDPLSFGEIRGIKAELVIGNKHYKASSMEDLIDEIEKIKDTHDISDFSKLDD